MSIYRNQIECCLKDYKKLALQFRCILDESPPGSLSTQSHYGSNQFLQNYTMKGKRVRKVITHDETMLRALAQKRFAQVALPVVEEIIGQLKNALDGIAALEPEALCEMLSRPYLLLPEEYLFDREVLVTGRI